MTRVINLSEFRQIKDSVSDKLAAQKPYLQTYLEDLSYSAEDCNPFLTVYWNLLIPTLKNLEYEEI
ncbi:hypothetical protein BpHYR1_006254 [Brachionus plicatilis]|uniref:Uncharacterized protein n=1 Tax=Brachionus plicatilis TaxID=10195 RepID=A0A3M7RAT5_BRAPC|nr:hypothetical protein BpHYR1_006254 [Brachionus plicatilis]